MRRWLLLVVALFVFPWVASAAPGKIEFNRDVRPILSDTCFKCHGRDKNAREADLRLDIRDEATKPQGDDHLIPIVPGKPEKSEAWRRIISKDPDEHMPPPDSHIVLTEAQKATLKKWIEQGAEYQPHWAFLPVKEPMLPEVQHKDWPRNQIDTFVLARLEKEGLTPSPEADRRTLIRRVTIDLTGLPPTREEVEAFLNDKRSDAYERVVDRLLASPRYGERMAVDWLDAARYADTHGFNNDSLRHMWRWRDWVIDAFNSNKPYDKFITEQLAGDLLPKATLDQKIASAFNRNHVMNSEGGIIGEEYRVEYAVDRTNTFGTVFMGLTIQCARCHDHKYDPITQKEFYSLLAYFNQLDEVGEIPRTEDPQPLLKAPTKQQQLDLAKIAAEIVPLEQQLTTIAKNGESSQAKWESQIAAGYPRDMRDVLPSSVRKVFQFDPIRQIIGTEERNRTASQRRAIRAYCLMRFDPEFRDVSSKMAGLEKRREAIEKNVSTVMVMAEMNPPRKTFVLKRGQYDQHGDEVHPNVPAALPPLPAKAPANRLGLAMWLTDASHPLTSRVAVNRFWYQYFGVGIVKTMEDWGVQGEMPSHPELLDYLASRFMRSGWDVKGLQRMIVASATYRQAARYTPELMERDPENRLLARGPHMRMSAEEIRDNALAVSGLLVEKIGGPSVMPYQPAGLWEDVVVGADYPGTKYVQAHGEDLYRRSMYTFWKRTAPPPALNTFDAPEREFCQVRRPMTNTPLQALVLMNDPTYVEASRKFAERMMRDGGNSSEDRIRYGYEVAAARSPKAAEIKVFQETFDRRLATFKAKPQAAEKLLAIGESKRDKKLDQCELAAYTTIASMMLNLDEVITK